MTRQRLGNGLDEIAEQYNLKRASDLPPRPAPRSPGAFAGRETAAPTTAPRSSEPLRGRETAAPTTAPRSSEPLRGRESAAPTPVSNIVKLTVRAKAAFKALAPAALALVASDGPVSVTLWGANGSVRRLGHNRGIWPAKVARTGSWKDTVTATHDKSPFHALGAQFRVWCINDEQRDRLADGTIELIARRSESDGGLDELLHDYQDLGPDLDLALFELEVHDIAGRLGFAAWSDDNFALFLDRVAARVEAERLAGRGLQRDEDAYDIAAAKEVLEIAKRRHLHF